MVAKPGEGSRGQARSEDTGGGKAGCRETGERLTNSGEDRTLACLRLSDSGEGRGS